MPDALINSQTPVTLPKKIAALYQCVYEKKGPGVSMVTVYQNA